MTLDQASRRRQVVSTTAGLLIGGLGFLLTLLDYGTDLARTAVPTGFLSNFFDMQGRQFLDGQLSFPDGALGIEGFVHDGKTYTYFPPWPALLRMPVLLTTHEYDGKLTLVSMAIAWIVFAVICTKLVWLCIRLLRPEQPLDRRTAVVAAAFIAAATGGTHLTFDAALPWTYHEVYVWAVTGATGALYWFVRTMVDLEDASIRWLFWFALVAIGSRATEGWAVCLVVIGVALLFRFRPRTERHRAQWWKVLLAGAVPLACSITLNLIKFDAIYMFPLQTQVWTEISAQRRAALAANGGSLTGPQFFTTSFMAYLRPDGIRFTDHFPFITLPAEPPPAYHGAFVDQAYRTGSVTAFMPLLLLGFLVAAVIAWRPRAGEVVRRFRAPLLASVLMTGGVMGYGYYSNRYASDFVPAMVLGGAVGAGLLTRWLHGRRIRLALPLVTLVAVVAAFSVAAQMATGAYAAATMARGSSLARFLTWQQDLSPDPPPVRLVDSFPRGGRTDDLAVEGDCDALHVNIGDQYEPWITVLERDRVLVLDRVGELRPGKVRLVAFDGGQHTDLYLETNRRQQGRLVLDFGNGIVVTGRWLDLGPTSQGTLRLGIRNQTGLGFFAVESIPGGYLGLVPARYLDEDVHTQPSVVDIDPDPTRLRALGLSATVSRGPADPLCERIAERAGLSTGG